MIGRSAVCLSVCVCLFVSICVCICLSASVCVCLSISLRLSICCLRLSICLRLLSICLPVCVCLLHLSASVCLCLCVYLARSVCRSVYLSIGRSVITRYVCLWPVCLWPVCLHVCVSVTTRLNLFKIFLCGFLLPGGGTQQVDLLWSSTLTPIIQPMSVRRSAGTFRLSAEVSRSVPGRFGSLLAQWTRESDHNSRGKENPRRVCGLAALWFRILLLHVVTLFSISLQAGYPQNWLEYLCLTSYDISYVWWIMSYVWPYASCHLKVMWSHGFGLCLAFRT